MKTRMVSSESATKTRMVSGESTTETRMVSSESTTETRMSGEIWGPLLEGVVRSQRDLGR